MLSQMKDFLSLFMLN